MREPNPKYKQAAKLAKKYGLEWVSVSDEHGVYKKIFRVRIGEKLFGYNCEFSEDMLEFAKSPDRIINIEFKRAIHELSKFTKTEEKKLVFMMRRQEERRTGKIPNW